MISSFSSLARSAHLTSQSPNSSQNQQQHSSSIYPHLPHLRQHLPDVSQHLPHFPQQITGQIAQQVPQLAQHLTGQIAQHIPQAAQHLPGQIANQLPSQITHQLPGLADQYLPNSLQPWHSLSGSSHPQPQPQPQQQQQQQTQQPPPQGQGGQVQQYGTGQRPIYSYSPLSTQLQPQQLESVSKDEDPIYGPLSRARGKVERALTGDNEISPDVADLLSTSCQDPYIQPPSPSSAFQPLKVTRTTPLPDALHQELNYKHLTAKMGLFEEIERAWFTVDNKLFLWDYNDGRDFSRYDEQPDTIECIGLVKAKRDVFVDDITYVLIICTASRLTLLGLSRPSARELSLYHTNLSADTPTAMLQISGTATGRVFMRGGSKDLYELEYTNESRWFFGSGARVSLTNRSSGSLSTWMPNLFTSSLPEGVEKLVVDQVQGRLFTLRTKGEMEMFDVSGTNFASRGRYTRLKGDLISRGLAGQAPAYAQANVVSLAVIGSHESRRTCLVAVTANGSRVYFSSMPFSPYSFRAPPNSSLHLSAQTLYSSGTLLGVQYDSSSPTPTTQLPSLVPNSGRQSAARENYESFEAPALQEWFVQEYIPSQVWTVVEVAATNPATSSTLLSKTDGLALSALPRQATTEARQYLILATSGLFWATQPRPIDMLQSDIEHEKDAAINLIRNTFGKTQLAAMGISMGAEGDMKQPDMVSAVSSIVLSAGSPQVRDTTAGRHIVYSGRHDGLAIALARQLRPIWSSRVTMLLPGQRQILGVPESLLLTVQGRLERLRQYLDEHPFPRVQAEGDAKLAWDQEELSVHGLQVLHKQAIEAISFLLLLSDYKLADIILRCDPQTQQTISSMTFQGLFTSTDGHNVARKLVTSLIEMQIGQELGRNIAAEMRDVLSTWRRGVIQEESIRRAEGSRDPFERNESLAESLRLFTRGAASMPMSRLQDVSKRYRDQQYIPGLRYAAQVDPNDKALDYIRDGQHPSDSRKAFYTTRMECYQCVIEALGLFDELLDRATASGNATSKRDEAYSSAINSDDEMFHDYLYDWHVTRGLQEQLLEFDTPFIERYLISTSNSVEDRRDLLWKYYARREDHLPAAKALFDLAIRQSPMSLNDRAYYLAQALTSAKSAASLGAEDVEFTSSLQERIDVAQVQMEIVRAVEAHSDMRDEEKVQVLGQLGSDLLGLDDLYQKFARPLRLYETILLILRTADTRIEDVCEAVWRQLMQQRSDGPAAHVAMGEIIKTLCRRYFPSEAAPLDIILPLVYSEAAGMAVKSPPGWASEALLEGSIPLRECWEAVMGLHDQAENEDERDFYSEEVGVLTGRWTDERDAISATEVERFASAYLLRTNANTAGRNARRLATREQMLAAKAAAARY